MTNEHLRCKTTKNLYQEPIATVELSTAKKRSKFIAGTLNVGNFLGFKSCGFTTFSYGWWFQRDFLCSPLFDQYFSDGLKPPTSLWAGNLWNLANLTWLRTFWSGKDQQYEDLNEKHCTSQETRCLKGLCRLLRMVKESKYHAFRRWLDIPIIWEYDWMPRVSKHRHIIQDSEIIFWNMNSEATTNHHQPTLPLSIPFRYKGSRP